MASLLNNITHLMTNTKGFELNIYVYRISLCRLVVRVVKCSGISRVIT